MNIKPLHIIYFLFIILILKFFSPEIEPTSLPKINLILKDHKFDQNEIYLKKNTQYILYITNNDSTNEEFESVDLSVEKIIPNNTTIYIILPALSTGIYKFHGEFHSETANGVFIVT
ncbi:MAG: cupredoxin domain-containing protein [Pseudomonadota bacterium]